MRAQAAADTRRTILDTAMRLFVERGYGQVTVADIADGASVALPTVYASTGGKAAILSTLIDEAMGDPVVEQTLNAMAASRSGEEVIELTAQGVRTDNERYHAIVQIMKTAAAVDATATQILVRSDDVYREALGQVTRRLGSLGRLKAGVTEWQATDILWFYLGREAWHILVADRRWSWDDAAQWLTQQVSAALLDPPEPPTADAPPRS
ncbi:TetR/AcrR family transcriptional regulator [Mycobacterium sp. 852002-51057_SCH5723018]|uniref:TetR/AcrR family transcriptional regulator n=1 Tax=Mycobacterium sp. 852002-51057_SCH5723018 TaxID=1834094 RepID=UPI0018D4BD57|nr:TetR/AcrR family transcriptional regulator [Mycobacterium sp. 852002-51057_SCH5723018]